MLVEGFYVTNHAKEEIERRQISLNDFENCLKSPGQIVSSRDNRTIYQSKIVTDIKTFLIRVIIQEQEVPKKVITVYKTSKIDKYWEA